LGWILKAAGLSGEKAGSRPATKTRSHQSVAVRLWWPSHMPRGHCWQGMRGRWRAGRQAVEEKREDGEGTKRWGWGDGGLEMQAKAKNSSSRARVSEAGGRHQVLVAGKTSHGAGSAAASTADGPSDATETAAGRWRDGRRGRYTYPGMHVACT
jgi:hypothetical protein